MTKLLSPLQHLPTVQRLQYKPRRVHHSHESFDKDDLRHYKAEPPDAGSRERRVSGVSVLGL